MNILSRVILTLILSFVAAFALTTTATATDVSITATTFSQLPFNPSNIGGDRSITVTATSGSPTVTSSAAFPPAIVGIGGFKVLIDGSVYTVSTVASTSSLTLTTNFSGSTASYTMTLYKYVLFRIYADRSFQPLNASYVVQPGTPGSSAFYKQVAASIINDGANNILYLPSITLPATTDATITNQARYVMGWYRADGSLIQYFTCGSVSQIVLPATTPTTLTAICAYNSPGGIVPPNAEAYTKAQIDQRFPSCTSGQMLYYAATGNVQSCLTVGSGLSISGGTITSSGGGGGSPGGSGTNLQYRAGASTFGGVTSSSVSGGEITLADDAFLKTADLASGVYGLQITDGSDQTIGSLQAWNSAGAGLGNFAFYAVNRKFNGQSVAWENTVSSTLGRAVVLSNAGIRMLVFPSGSVTPSEPLVINDSGLKITLGSDATGDTFYRDSGGQVARLGIGTAGQCLVVSGGLPAWGSCSAGSITGTIANTQVAFGTGANTIGGEAAFTYTSGTDTLALAGHQTITQASTSTVPLTVQAAGSSSVEMVRFQNSSGQDKLGVTADANLYWRGQTTSVTVAGASDAKVYYDKQGGSNDGMLLLSRGGGGYQVVLSVASDGSSGDCLQTNGNKVFSFGACTSGLPVADTTAVVKGSGDPTKQLRFEVDGFTGGATRIMTPPDANIVVAGSASALTSTRVPFVTTGGLLTDSADLTYTTGSKFLDVAGTNAAVRINGGQHPGSGGGVVMPFIGGSNSSGPGIWWTSNSYGSQSGLWLSNGLNWQSANSTHSSIKLRNSTGTSSDGTIIFTMSPDTGTVEIGPYGTSAGNTSEIRYQELAANGSNYFATKAADSIGTSYTMTWPTDTPSAGEVLTVTALSGSTISTEWAAGGGGSGITIGTTTISSGAAGRLLYETSGNVVGEVAGSSADANGALTLAATARTSGVAPYLRIQAPADTGQTTDTEFPGIFLGGNSSGATVTRTGADGTTYALQREIIAPAVTLAYAGATTVTTAVGADFSSPIAGTNATLTSSYAMRLNPSATAHKGLLINNSTTNATGAFIDMQTGGTSRVTILPFDTGGSAVAGWIDMTTAGPSAIGNGGVGANVWVGYVAAGGQYIGDATTGDIVMRNTSGRLMFGTSGVDPAAMAINGGLVGVGISTGLGAQHHVVSFNAARIAQRVDSLANSTVDLLSYNLNADDTSTVANLATFNTNSNGTAAAGFGSGLTFALETSTTNDTTAGSLNWLWTTATHASRTSAIDVYTVYNAGSAANNLRLTEGRLTLPRAGDANPGTGELTSLGAASLYVKGSKFVIAYNNAGVITYITIPLDGSTTTWTQTTSAP